jgi:hypothetical protein
MTSDRTLKNVFNIKPVVRSVGRPKLRWKNGVNQDMQTLGVNNGKNAALERNERTQLLKKAKVHHGQSSQ